jgi:hypothetical protein
MGARNQLGYRAALIDEFCVAYIRHLREMAAGRPARPESTLSLNGR